MSNPSFFVVGTERTRGSAPTRTPLPHEAFPQPWVVNLGQHVEPRTVSEGQTVGLVLIGLLASMAIALVLLSGCNPTGGIDRAQAAFEKREGSKSHSYDFDAWRKAGELKCQSAPTLRICLATPVIARSHTGEETYVARDFMSFACSITECAWVDP